MRKSNLLLLAALVLIGGALAAIYGHAIDSPFLFDDTSGIIKNSSITRLWPLVGDTERPGPLNPAKNLPTSGRPLVSLSLALNYHFGQLNPVGYRVFNLIIHLLSALLLMAIVKRTLCLDYFGGRFDRASGPLALAVALLWAVHPLQTEAVEYVTQRTELLVGFFYLATLYSSLRYWAAGSPAGRTTWLTIAIVAALAGMASKEVMVTAPVIVLLFERTFVAGSFSPRMADIVALVRRLVLNLGLFGLSSITTCRSRGCRGFRSRIARSRLVAHANQGALVYLKLTVWPWPLSIHYEIPYLETLGAAWPWLVGPVRSWFLPPYIFLAAQGGLGFVGAWVFLILSPTLVVPIVTEVAAERRMYLPLAALITLLVAGGYWLAQQVALAIAGRRTEHPLEPLAANCWWNCKFAAGRCLGHRRFSPPGGL